MKNKRNLCVDIVRFQFQVCFDKSFILVDFNIYLTNSKKRPKLLFQFRLDSQNHRLRTFIRTKALSLSLTHSYSHTAAYKLCACFSHACNNLIQEQQQRSIYKLNRRAKDKRGNRTTDQKEQPINKSWRLRHHRRRCRRHRRYWRASSGSSAR